MVHKKEWLDVEVNSIKALVNTIESDGYGERFSKKTLHETFNVPFSIIKRVGKRQLIEDREAYDRMELYVYPHRVEGITGYRLLVDIAMQLPTGAGYDKLNDVQGEGKSESMCRPWSKKGLYAHQLSMLILNALEMEPETIHNMIKRRVL